MEPTRRTMLRKRIYDAVASRWRELGLPGEAPAVLAYEPEEAPKKSRD